MSTKINCLHLRPEPERRQDRLISHGVETGRMDPQRREPACGVTKLERRHIALRRFVSKSSHKTSGPEDAAQQLCRPRNGILANLLFFLCQIKEHSVEAKLYRMIRDA